MKAAMRALAVLFVLMIAAAPAARGVRIGQKKPACKEVVRLEGEFFLEVVDTETNEIAHLPVEGVRTDPVLLEPGHTYTLRFMAGKTPTSPALRAKYRLGKGAVWILLAYAPVATGGFSLDREYSVSSIEKLIIETSGPGRRKLHLRLSRCYKGGSRFFHQPNELVIPLVVRSPPSSQIP